MQHNCDQWRIEQGSTPLAILFTENSLSSLPGRPENFENQQPQFWEFTHIWYCLLFFLQKLGLGISYYFYGPSFFNHGAGANNFCTIYFLPQDRRCSRLHHHHHSMHYLLLAVDTGKEVRRCGVSSNKLSTSSMYLIYYLMFNVDVTMVMVTMAVAGCPLL